MLRGINVGGYRKVGMPELVKLYTSLGLVDVRTYVQSGNVVFEHSGPDASSLATRIERGLRDQLGLDVPVFIRSRDDFERIVARYPFAGKYEARSHVTFLYSKPSRIPADKIGKVASEERHSQSAAGRSISFVLMDMVGRSCQLASSREC